jgi:glycosyltransferase involved in cell wall biosynthesis
MRILLWHGYLLTGSGSNIYTANVARAWRDRGHDVLLLCQDRRARELEFVDADGDFTAGNEAFSTRETGTTPASGRVHVVRPSIGEILPVYVYDAYEGFTAKRFVDLTSEELFAYTEANVRALTTAIEEHEPNAIVTGHEIMGPYIARRACEPSGAAYLAKLHGSALEYAVKPQERYLRYAVEGLGGARIVAGGSSYMVKEAASVIPGWLDRAVVVNPGCDVDLFRPADRSSPGPFVVGYVGKLLESKGVHHLLAALGLTATSDLETVVVGYGGMEGRLHALHRTFRTADRDAARRIARGGDGGDPLPALATFLDSPRADEAFWRQVVEVDVEWTGRLDHGPLATRLPSFDVLAVPSVVAEAFGMVAAEAAACGVLPVVPDHSGIAEAGRAIEAELARPGLLTFDPDEPIESLARAVDRVLAVPPDERSRLGRAAADLARRRWSWKNVADLLLRHALTR